MKLFGLSFLLSFCVCVAARCHAMDAGSVAMFHGAQKAFAACAGLQGVNVIDGGNVVCLRGKIDPTMFISLVNLKDGIRQRPYVIVSGPGGYVDSSVYMVRLLDAYDPIPVAGDMCASACAQFLFLMGRHRVLLHCADVVIHGGPWAVRDVLAENRSDEFKQRLIANIWQFEDFYRKRHISLDMANKPPANIQKKIKAGEVVFWPWSINKLRSFGVEGIVSENNPDEDVPRDYAKSCLAHH